MFALAAALLVSPAVAPQPPGDGDLLGLPPSSVLVEEVVLPQGGGFGGNSPFEGFGGGGGFGGGQFEGQFQHIVTQESDTGELYVQGRRVLVLISPDGSKVWGWSQGSGKMTPLPVDVPKEERGKVQPIVGQDVAMLVVEGTVYAFGGSSGEWGSHPVGESDAVKHLGLPVVGATVAATRTADGVYAYSGVSGKGGLHELGEGEEAVAPSVGIDYAMVRSPKSFGMFSGETGTWGSVRYAEPAGDAESNDAAE